MGKSKRREILCTVGFKKGFKQYNKGVNYEKEISVLKNGSKYVRPEQNLHKMVSTKLLPDTKAICGVPVDIDFRLLIPQKVGGGRVVRWCWVNLQCRGVLLIWIRVGQGHTALVVGADGGCLDIFSLVYHFSLLSPSLWETA